MTKVTRTIIPLVIVIFSATVILLNIRSSKQSSTTSDLARSKATYPKEISKQTRQADKIIPLEKEETKIMEKSSHGDKILSSEEAKTAPLKKVVSLENKPLTLEEVNILTENEIIGEDEAKEIMKLEKLLKEEIK